MKINKKIIIIVAFILVGLACVGLILGFTLAKWTTNGDVSQGIPIDIINGNASEQYIYFYGLNEDGEFTTDGIVSYAVVGYWGLVAELEIPETHNDLPVTHVLFLNEGEYLNNRLSNNAIITSIIIPSSVIVIGDGVCAQMPELRYLKFEKGDAPLRIGAMAFAGCGKLEGKNIINGGRNILEGVKAFEGCGEAVS